MARTGIESLAFPLGAGAAVLLCGGALSLGVEWYEQDQMLNDQVSEFKGNPAVFAITQPEDQPAGKTVASWDRDGTSHFTVKIEGNMASLSDPNQSFIADGPRSGPIVSCSSLAVEAAFTHSFEMDGKSYRAIVTRMGNAAVCAED